MPGRDDRAVADLTEFARLEVASGDIEPWAETLRAAFTTDSTERMLWMVHLYNATDDLGSAVVILNAAPSARLWAEPRRDRRPRETAGRVFLGGERRNLRGGKIVHRLDSYTTCLAGDTQHRWISEALASPDPTTNFTMIMPYLQRVWGVGRLAAFEWAEFLAKVGGYPIDTDDGCLWQSSGPRESLERIYHAGARASSTTWLHDHAVALKDDLAAAGVPLSWWDFETVICDFNVMRKGRYYPGKHLAMISGEIAGAAEPWRTTLTAAYRATIPAGWRDVAPGVDKGLCRAYAATGRIRTALEPA